MAERSQILSCYQDDAASRVLLSGLFGSYRASDSELHRQQAYKHYPIGKGGVAVSDRLAGEVISLPMHAYLDVATQDRIIVALRRGLKK